MKNSPLYHRDSHVSPIHDQPLCPLLHTCYVKYCIYVVWRFGPSNMRCMAREFEHSSHLKTLALRLWCIILYREAVSVSSGSQQTSDPAPPSRSDAQNILPVLSLNIPPSLAGSKWQKHYSECTDAPKAQPSSFVKFSEKIASQSSHSKWWWWRSPDQRAPSHQDECNISGLSWDGMHSYIHCAHFWDICACCTYNLMAHWYISFAILILLCRQNLAKNVLSAEPQTDAITGKEEDKGKGTPSSIQVFDTPEGSCGVQQSLTVALRDQVAQFLKDDPPSASFRLLNLVWNVRLLYV